MLRVALDLEMNDNLEKSIIQIGACVFDIYSAQIVSTFDTFVYQKEQISPYIQDLTGITQVNVTTAKSLENGYFKLLFWLKSTKCKVFPIVTWGTGDLPLFRSQLSKDIEWKLGRTEMNAKNLFQAYREANGKSTQGGLSTSMKNFGLNFIGQKHNAKDDAINTARIYCELLKKLRI